MIRNETERVIARARTRVESQNGATKHGAQVSAASRPALADFGHVLTPTDWRQDLLPSLLRPTAEMNSTAAGFGGAVNPLANPSPSLEAIAICFFVNNYVSFPSGPSPGFLSYIISALEPDSPGSSLVKSAVQAVGLASLASTTGGGAELTHKSWVYYMETSRQISQDLAEPAKAKQDSTLIVIILFSLFEAITCIGFSSLDAWKQHVEGAASILLLRGSSQFETPTGRLIFHETIAHLVVACSRMWQPFSPRIRMLRLAAANFSLPSQPPWVLGCAHSDIMDLSAAVDCDKSVAFLEGSWESLLLQALELDGQIESFFEGLPAGWQFTRHKDILLDGNIFYDGTYHVYQNWWVIKIWCAMRASRIILHRIVYCLLHREASIWAPQELAPGGSYAGLKIKSVGVIEAMRDDILASIPQALGDVSSGSLSMGSNADGNMMSSRGTGRAAVAYFVLWWVYLAGALTINPPETQSWAAHCLRRITSRFGILHAQFLGNRLEMRQVSFPIAGGSVCRI